MDLAKIENVFINLKKEVEKFGKEISIVVVTKYVYDIVVLSKLADIGIKDIAENYIQHMEYKYKELKNKNFPIEKYNWHFIGHLQKNKVKKAVAISYLIQSVDSVELAKKINLEGEKINKIQECLLELKVSQEETKFGIDEENIYKINDEIYSLNLKNIKIIGLMTMAPYFKNPEFTRPYFKKAYNIFCEIKKKYNDFRILSMGMSNDYKVALEEGTNMLRIGSLLFGHNLS